MKTLWAMLVISSVVILAAILWNYIFDLWDKKDD